ncbi:MAB_1171c family putative transporter [Pseudonocardia sp.]|uniref:MAB_1171c family putative transporter n=1 Tax=Pseudonocardia sp. TaxID=60912 RepID=UPI0026267700|nr:MAB_1171c family putative transporter [Pseudonocardia sp.]
MPDPRAPDLLALATAAGEPVLVAGVVTLWIVVLLRLPTTIGSAPRRRLLVAVAGLAGSVTVYLDPVTALLSSSVLASSCGIVMNLWGVLSAAFILDFVLAALSRRRPWPVYGVAVAVCVGLVLLDRADGGAQAGCVSSLQVPWYSPFWWLLCLAHVAAVVPAVLVTARSASRAESRSVRVGLALLCAAFVSSTFFWGVVVIARLTTGAGWIGGLFSLNIAVTTWLMAAGTAVPLAVHAGRWARSYWLRWRLRGLWRALVAAVPGVRMPGGPLPGLGRSSADLRLYRRVIEIRDALLVLRHRVDGPTADAARSHVRRARPGVDEEPAVVACWLALALESDGGPPAATGWPADPATPAQDIWTSEIAFQVALARFRTQPFVVAFARSVRTPGNELAGGVRR